MSVLAPASPAAALAVPTDCVIDDGGANDAPNQSDLTQHCGNSGDGAPFELNVSVNLDIATLGGNNTTGVCTLLNSDGDAYANFAACATVAGTGFGNLLELDEVSLYTCTDTKADRCSSPSLISPPYSTQCEVTQESTDPFPPPAPGPGDDYPVDTRIVCGIDLADFGVASAVPMDTCAFPAGPNTNPGDCAVFETCAVNADCDDNNTCTAEYCDITSICAHVPIFGAPCSDGLFCNGDETCTALGFCGEGTGIPVACNDGVICTIDVCDELGDVCENVPRNSLCSDDLFCTGVETCDAVSGCVAGLPPDCSDGIGCTLDACNETLNNCDHVSVDAVCDNGLFCDGAESCSSSLGCLPGLPPVCADAVACTTDSCNEGTDLCDHVANNAVCSDSLFCDGAETCDVVLGCQAGTPPNCADVVGCTTDGCNEATNSCDHVPDNGACSDGAFCSGVEICDPTLGCGAGVNPCPGAICDEPTDQCVGCAVDADCDNSVFCDGAEVCTAGVCAAGTLPDCDDGVGCTLDLCNEATNACDNPAVDALCDDSLFCDGSETCNALTGCVPGTAPNCSDAIACTTDNCVEASDDCSHTPVHALCSNGQYCDGIESCSAISGCVSGSPVVCSDARVCTIDSCNESEDHCEHDFSFCRCGDSEVTFGEQCDPPVAADTFEDCNDDIDDDGDGHIDCLDPDCQVSSRSVTCDESCTIDEVCREFLSDPATILYGMSSRPDRVSVHARMPLASLEMLSSAAGTVTFEISNELGPIYHASLDAGDFRSASNRQQFRFRDKLARTLGLASARRGLGDVRISLRSFDDVPYIVFRIRAYGDFSNADRSLMTTEFTVGTNVGFVTANWAARRRGWLLFARDF